MAHDAILEMSDVHHPDVEFQPDGNSSDQIFEGGTGLTYRDYLVLPGYIDFHPSDVHLETRVTRNISIHRPMIFHQPCP